MSNPGGVMIEEAPVAASAQRRNEVPKSATPAPMPQSFSPELPVEIRRAPRRMPDVEDFPAVAQREYRAKGPTPASQPSEQQPKRQGLFERLAGMGRRTDDSHTLVTPQAVSARDHRSGRQGEGRSWPAAGPDRQQHGDRDVDDQGVELSEYFKRDRK